MKRRFLASAAFLIGTVMTWYVFRLLHALGAMQSGMSAGPIPGAPTSESLIPWFAYAYFAISAIGVLMAKKRRGLWLIAGLAHLMLLITFCLICSEPRDESFSNFFSEALTVAFSMAIYLTPWNSVWLLTLFGREGAQKQSPESGKSR